MTYLALRAAFIMCRMKTGSASSRFQLPGEPLLGIWPWASVWGQTQTGLGGKDLAVITVHRLTKERGIFSVYKILADICLAQSWTLSFTKRKGLWNLDKPSALELCLPTSGCHLFPARLGEHFNVMSKHKSVSSVLFFFSFCFVLPWSPSQQ